MTEQALINYNELARSYDIAKMHQGILPAGRYAGFDAIQLDSAGVDHLMLEFLHTQSGFVSISDVNATKSNQAKIVTPEGIIIEYEVVDSFRVDFELTSAWRRDAIVIDHDWQLVAGGQSSTISVIKGTEAATAELALPPAATNSTTQTILGYVLLEPDASSIGEMTWERNPTPLPGNEETMAFLDLITALDASKLDKADPVLTAGTPYIGGSGSGTASADWIFPTNQTLCHRNERGQVFFQGRVQCDVQPPQTVVSTSKILMFQLDSTLIPNRPFNTPLVFPVFNETTRDECYIEVAANGEVSFVPNTVSTLNKVSTGDWINFSLSWWTL